MPGKYRKAFAFDLKLQVFGWTRFTTGLLRAGLSKYGARLEALFRGPTQWCVQKFAERDKVIITEILSYGKKRDPTRVKPS